MRDPAFPAFSGIAFVLLLLPLPLQLQSRNWGLICYLFWITTLILIYFVNSVMWARTTAELAPVWCDINTKLQVGAQLGVPTGATAVLRQLERIASTRIISQTPRQKRNNTIIDLVLGAGLPISFMVTHTVVQGRRYDIVEEFGCIFTLYKSWPMLFLVTLPPLIFSLAALVYAALAFRWFILRRRQFKAVLLQSPGAGLTASRYLRLLLLTSMELFISFPGQVVNAYYNLKPTESKETSFPLPYISWSYVHAGFNTVYAYSVDDLVAYSRASYIVPEYLRWSIVMGGFLVFFCLGCSSENIAYVKASASTIRDRIVKRRNVANTPTAPRLQFHQQTHEVVHDAVGSQSFDDIEIATAKGADVYAMESPQSTKFAPSAI